MEQISIKGIIVGAIIDWVTSLTFTLPLVFYLMFTRGFARLPQDQMKAALSAAMHTDPPIVATGFLIGTACSVLGSYVAGALARRAQVLNGVLSALLPGLSGYYSLIRGTYQRPLWLVLFALFVLSPLAGALGGYLALLQARKSEVPA